MRVPISLLILSAVAAAEPPKVLVTGLTNPESVAVAPDGAVFVSVMGERGKAGDGTIVQIVAGKPVVFAEGLDDPRGLVAFKDALFTTDNNRIWRIPRKGKPEVHAAASAFPKPPVMLNDIDVDPNGVLYVSDMRGSAIYRVDAKKVVTLVVDAAKAPAIKAPNGVLLDGIHSLLVVDRESGELNRVRLSDRTVNKVADGFGGGDGLAFDKFGRLFVSDVAGGKVYGIARPGAKPVLIAEGFGSAADIGFDPVTKRVLVPDMKAGTVSAVSPVIPGFEVDESPLPFDTEVAFPDLKWTGWAPLDDAGLQTPLRPILLTHAGDGSNRVFVPTQHGVIHVFPNDQKATKTDVFLDLSAKVKYSDKTNEEGFLGLAFHPQYKTNGEFFVFYTVKTPALTTSSRASG